MGTEKKKKKKTIPNTSSIESRGKVKRERENYYSPVFGILTA